MVPKWLRDGIEGRSLKATLRLYVAGLIVLAPAAAFIGYLFGGQMAFQATPLLVLILVGVEYALCYPEKLSRVIPGHRLIPSRMPSQPSQEGEDPPRIKVIGVGGAGGSAVNAMMQTHMTGVEFIVPDTDVSKFDSHLAPIKLCLGSELTRGLGTRANPEIGQKAAEQEIDKITEVVGNAPVVFIIAGLGGGTGSGAVPIIASIARGKGILTVAVVTKPFAFEGRSRMQQAEAAIHELYGHVDTLIVISNQLLLEIVDKRTSLRDAFKVADDILRQAVQGIADLVTVSGSFHFADLRKFLSAGVGGLGIGVAHGEGRTEKATRQALASPLLEEFPVAKARRVLINVTGDPDLSIFEVHKAVSIVHETTRADASIMFSSVVDENVTDEVHVTIIATDFSAEDSRRASKQIPTSGKRHALKCTSGVVLLDRSADSQVSGASD